MINSKSVTVFDVARVAGVSKSTVSLVLTGSSKVSEKSREKVQKAIIDTGYIYNRDAASLRSRKSNLVAIIINDLSNPYSAQLAEGLERQIRQIGLFPILVNSGENVDTQDQLVQRLKEYKIAAFIMCPAPGTTAEWTNKLVQQGFPIIHIMREIEGANVATVLPDNIAGTSLATQHILDKGHRKIAFLGGNERISDYHQRLAGFVNTMTAHGTPPPQELCIQSETTRNGGRQAMAEVLAVEPDIEAVVCFSDVVAYGAIEHMRFHGKKPGKDIAVTGFDDLKDSRLMSPSLSTVHIDANKIGIAVCDLLSNLKNGLPTKTVIDVTFIARESG
ncbi:MAG: LacI family DNA-binding transcriptional regulator [Arenicella sp.]|nr:LacI family DNA-binding transcriptional regulator [Arenicella sp.]